MNGIFLALQFFSIIPIHKEYPMEKKDITAMYATLPFIGLFIGSISFLVYLTGQMTFSFSPFLLASLLVVTGFILTGGLHLDGWADTADAYFSYRKIEKRHEILEDPRLGAFGTMALILLMLMKVAVIYEAISQQLPMLVLLCFIPFIVRAFLIYCFIWIPSAKIAGLGAFFKAHILSKPLLIFTTIVIICAFAVLLFITQNVLVILAIALMLVGSVLIYKKWTLKHFGGMTGDLAGAYIEGMEVFVWLLLIALL